MKKILYAISALMLLSVAFSISSCSDDDPEIVYTPSVNNVPQRLVVPGESIIIDGANLTSKVQVMFNGKALTSNLLSSHELSIDIEEGMVSDQLYILFEGDTIYYAYLSIKDTKWNQLYESQEAIISYEFANRDLGYILQSDEIRKVSPFSDNIKYSGGSFTALHVLDEQTAFVIKDSKSILKTIDGGASWIEVTVSEDILLTDIHFMDADEGIAIGRKDTRHGVIMRTKDGGETWAEEFSEQGVYFNDNAEIIQIADLAKPFIIITVPDSNDLIVMSDEASWGVKSLNQPHIAFNDIDVVGPADYWAVGANLLYRSVDGASGWEEKYIYFEEAEHKIISVHFFDTKNGVVLTNLGGVAKTTDGGSTWSITYSGLQHLNSVQYLASTKSILAGTDNEIFISTF